MNNADRVGVVLGDNGGTGALYQSGGSLLIQSGPDVDNFIIGRSANSYGYFEVSGGTNRLSEFGVGSGYGGNGMMSVLGGEITVTNYFNIGRADSVNGQVGIVNLTGGSVRALNNSYDTTLAVGNATGKNTVMTVGANGSFSTAQRGISLNSSWGNYSNNASLNLNGGLVETGYIWSERTAGNQFLNFNGGTLKAIANNGAFINNLDRITINQGGAKFDTAGFNVTIGQSLQAPAGKGLSSIAIADGGTGYIAPPIVEISGGGGLGATAYAEIDRVTGAVTNIVISNPGNGYTSPPTVVLKQGGSLTAATLGTVALADNVSGGITKQGSGVLTLSAGNTYTGTTLVSQGTLRAGVASNAFGITSAMVLSNAAGVLVELNGFDQTIGSLAGGGGTGGTVSLGNRTLTMGSDNTSTTFGGTINGTGGQIVKIGTGTQTLTRGSSYTGATTVTAGTLQVVANNALGTTDGGTVVGASGRIDIRNVNYAAAEALTLNGGTVANSFGTTFFAGAVTLGANSTADVTGDSLFLTGNIGGGFDLNKTGSGTLIFTGTANQASTTISAGTLQLGNDGTLGTLNGRIINQSALVVSRSDAASLTNEISGSGTITKKGTNTVTLLAANSFSGLTTIEGGVLQIGNGGATKLAAGTVTLTGNLSYSGGTTIAAGVLEIGNGGTSGAIGSGAITNQGVLAFNRADNLNVPGGISGNGELRQNGSGTLTLSGASTYTGATRVNAGRLATAADNLLSDSSALIVAGGATLQLGGNDGIGSLAGAGSVLLGTNNLTAGLDNTDTTWSGEIGGLGGLTKVGTGNLTLSGANTFLGDAVLSGGQLTIDSATALDRSIFLDVQTNTVLLVRTNILVGALETAGTINRVGNAEIRAAQTVTSQGEINAVIADFAGDSNFPAFQAGLWKRSNGLTTVGAANTFTGEVKVTGGTLKLGTNGSFASGSSLILQGGSSILDLSGKTQEFAKISAISGQVALGAGTLAVGGTNLSEFGGVISGTGGFTQKGTGTTILGGTNTYSGSTAVDAGKLVVNGALNTAGTVTVAAGAKLGGSGIVGTIGGAGLVEAGNSPGILTATSLDLSGGLDFNFELFGFNPNYTSAMNSGNDIVRLTGSTPFGSDFSAANALNFYLTLPSNFAFGTAQVFTGGFLADFANNLSALGTKWLDNIKKATLNFFVADSTGGVNYNGNKYVSLSDYAKNTAGQRDANFVLSAENAGGVAMADGSTTAGTAKVLGLQMISTI
ncbi:MAG: hypothetical protein EBV34_14185, partial [Betaproteobacteria bacterium]|nr:hypothetical protein [Betaproteobacteria bacterium]